MENQIPNFSLLVERLAKTKRISYLDAVLEYCESNLVEPEDIAKQISSSLKEKIEAEFRSLGYLPRMAQLEFE